MAPIGPLFPVGILLEGAALTTIAPAAAQDRSILLRRVTVLAGRTDMDVLLGHLAEGSGSRTGPWF